MAADSEIPGRPDDVAVAAAAWLARRDRGLTAAEQDAYLEWLRAAPLHARMVAHLEKTWGALDALAEWRPAHSAQPNPDLLVRPRAGRFARMLRWPVVAGSVAAAAVLAGAVFYAVERPAAAMVRVIPSPERLTLADGSVVDLNHGGKITTEFTPETRRVRLVSGEAHFTVTKNPARPFLVEAGGVTVRAVGTAFDVRRASGAVEVLVTEGKVQIERPGAAMVTAVAATSGASEAAARPAPAPTPLIAGERAVIDTTTAAAAAPVVAAVSSVEIARALSWQGVRLEFEGLPLAEVVNEFNLRNRQQLVIADAATGKVRVAGTFRADNVDAFVRLLEASFSVTALRRDDGALVLRHEK